MYLNPVAYKGDRASYEAAYSYLPGRENGPADAYRHILIAADLTLTYGESVARFILGLHEGNGGGSLLNGPSKESLMDIHNNEVGYAIGVKLASEYPSYDLNTGVISTATWLDILDAVREVIDQSDGTGANGTAQWMDPRAWDKNPRLKDNTELPTDHPLVNWGDNRVPWPEGPFPREDKDYDPNNNIITQGQPSAFWKAFEKFLSYVTPPSMNSPIILDLNGDGVKTVDLKDSEVMFDLNGNGRKQLTGWVDKNDGLLVLDRNGNQVIDDGRELFGDGTLKSDGSGLCHDRFEALAQEDSNGDGIIDAADANWSKLRIWRDLNQNGRTDEGELFTLDELGITSLNLNYTRNSNASNPSGGNYLFGTGSYTTSDGQSHELADYFFEQDSFHSKFTDPVDVPQDIMQSLPGLGGSGAVRDLWSACALNPALKELLTSFCAAGSREEQRALLDELLTVWADSSGFLYFDERVAGRYDQVLYGWGANNMDPD